MARSTIDPLVVGRVVGDVLDVFVPTAALTVCYGSKQMSNGCDVKPSMAAERPYVHVDGKLSNHSSDDLFILVMVDPDAPSPSEPKLREWLHWIVVGIPNGTDASKGKEIVEYMGPRPSTGIHRFVFSLYKLNGATTDQAISVPEARSNFSTRRFAADHGLGLPVCAAYFNSQKEPGCNRRSSR